VAVKLRPPARAREDLTRLCAGERDIAELVDEADELVASVVPHDGACWHTTDPATLIETTFRTIDLPPRHERVAELEYGVPDYNKFAMLARARQHSGVLSEATGGQLHRSARYREIMHPVGYRGELRVSLVVDGACWGSIAVFRKAPRDFTEDERRFAHDIAPILAQSFRSAAVRMMSTEARADVGPGLILFDGARQVESVTTAAMVWLAELGFVGDVDTDPLPLAVSAVAERARAVGGDATARVRGAGGAWVAVDASAASGPTPGRIALILQSATPTSMAPLIAAAHGLSPRERELTELVLQGFGTTEIAERLVISPLTVQGHLKSIFEKVGVRSRRELVSTMFVRHYQPRIVAMGSPARPSVHRLPTATPTSGP
jgi:DNA-binding CsgD family transcriptional regulator